MSEAKPTLYGATYSVYVRAARTALEAKHVKYHLENIDIFAKDGIPQFYRSLNPFARIPTLVHGDFTLFETVAINRYIDEAFDGPALQPADARGRARMTQIISMADTSAYRPLVWDIYVERISKPREGEAGNEALIASALPRARTYLSALNDLVAEGPYLLGESPGLADFHTAPIFGYFLETEEGQVLMSDFPRLQRWWAAMSVYEPWQIAQTK